MSFKRTHGEDFDQEMKPLKLWGKIHLLPLRWFSQLFCYSHGSLTGIWAVVTTTISLVLRNTGSPNWPHLPSSWLSFLSCSSSAVSWKFKRKNGHGLQPLTSPTSTCLNGFLLQNHVITCMFALLSVLYYPSEIEIIAFPSCVSPGTESVAQKLSLLNRWLLIEGWCYGSLASTCVVHTLLRR